MPTKSKKVSKKPRERKNKIKQIDFIDNEVVENVFDNNLGGDQVFGVEPISESAEFMDSMRQLKEKLESRDRLQHDVVENSDKDGSFRSGFLFFMLFFLIGFLIFVIFYFVL